MEQPLPHSPSRAGMMALTSPISIPAAAAPEISAAHEEVRYLRWPAHCASKEASKQGGWKAAPTLSHRTSKGQWWQQWGKTELAAPAWSLPSCQHTHPAGKGQGTVLTDEEVAFLSPQAKVHRSSFLEKACPAHGVASLKGATESREPVQANLYVLLY